MSELFTGVISGIVASVAFYTFLIFVRPKIDISDKICQTIEGNSQTLRIKVVNKTRSMLTNVKYTLLFCEMSGDGVCVIREIPALKGALTVINKYSRKDKNSEYAIRFTYGIDTSVIDVSNGWLEFSIYANHSFSNTTACVKKRYMSSDISTGIFETGKSMRILAVPPQK